MPHFTPAELRDRVLEAPLRTVELRVSAPVINRHIAALERGARSPAIKVADGTVLGGGLHWYIASLVLGLVPRLETVDGAPETPVRYSLRQVIFEGLDWENMTGRRA